MSSIRNSLLNSLNTSSIQLFTNSLKKCINHGIISPCDLRLLANKTFCHIDEFNLSQATTILHSFSLPIYRNFQLFTSLTGRIRDLLNDETPSISDSIKIINSCGRLHYSDSELFPILLNVIKNNIDHIKTKNLISILHSLTKLRYFDYELMSCFSPDSLKGLHEISETSLANFTIALSKMYNNCTRENPELFDSGIKIISFLLPEIKSRSQFGSSLDNFRHIIALLNMKHLIINDGELNECLEQLVKFTNCSVLYYEHLIILLESIVKFDYPNHDFIFEVLLPNLLNKITDFNSSPELDLRILTSLSSLPRLTKTYQFLSEQILNNLSKRLEIHPKFTKHIFGLINSLSANPDPFLENLQKFLENKNTILELDTVSEIKSSIARSSKSWSQLESLVKIL